jgi:hypothetical protein
MPDYHVLHALFNDQPDHCWEVLSKVEHAARLPDLSPRYLQRAIFNNQRLAAQRVVAPMEPAQPWRQHQPEHSGMVQADTYGPTPSIGVDPRCPLLAQEGLKPQLLTAEMTEAFIQAWLQEADARAAQIKDRRGWLVWGLTSGFLPGAHPKLPPRSGPMQQSRPTFQQHEQQTIARPDSDRASSMPPSAVPSTAASGQHTAWRTVLDQLETALPRREFETWLKETALIDLDAGRAIIGTPNIFAREKLEAHYLPLIQHTLQFVLGQAVDVQVVIGA